MVAERLIEILSVHPRASVCIRREGCEVVEVEEEQILFSRDEVFFGADDICYVGDVFVVAVS